MADAFYDPGATYDDSELSHELSHSGSDWSVMGEQVTYEEGYEGGPRYRSVPPQPDIGFPGAGCQVASSAAAEFYDPDHDYGFRSVSAEFASKEARMPLAVPSLQRTAKDVFAPLPLEAPCKPVSHVSASLQPSCNDGLCAPPLPAQPFELEPTHLICRADATPAEVRAALDVCLLGGGAPRRVEGMMIEVDGLFNAAKFKYKCSISGDYVAGAPVSSVAAGAPPMPSLGGALLTAPLSFVARVFRDGTRGGASDGGHMVIEFQRRRGSGLLFQRLFGALARSAALAPVLALVPAPASALAQVRAPVDGLAAPAPAPAAACASAPSSSDGFAPLCAMLRAGGECGVAAAALVAAAAASSSLAARAHAEHGVADALVAQLRAMCIDAEGAAPAVATAHSDAAAYARAVAAIAEGTKDIASDTSDGLAQQLRALAATFVASRDGGDGSCRWQELHERRAARQCERALKALGAH